MFLWDWFTGILNFLGKHQIAVLQICASCVLLHVLVAFIAGQNSIFAVQLFLNLNCMSVIHQTDRCSGRCYLVFEYLVFVELYKIHTNLLFQDCTRNLASWYFLVWTTLAKRRCCICSKMHEWHSMFPHFILVCCMLFLAWSLPHDCKFIIRNIIEIFFLSLKNK